MSYLNLATHQVLLRSYEELAILHSRKNKPQTFKESEDELSKNFMKIFNKEALYTTNFIGPLSYQAFSFLKLLALS